MEAVRECGYELLPHSPYSPDLAHSDFHLFSRLKNTFGVRGLMMTAATEAWLGDQDVGFYQSGINSWQT